MNMPLWLGLVETTPGLPPRLCSGTLQRFLRPPTGKGNDFTCRVHGMTSSLTQQTFGAGGGEGGGGESH